MLRKLLGKDKGRDSEMPFKFVRSPGGGQEVAVRRSFSSLNLEGDSWRQWLPWNCFSSLDYGLSGEPWYSFLPFCGSEEDSDTSTLLSKHQKMIIATTWPFLAEEIPSVGLSVQACLFEKDPSLQSLFEFRDKRGQDLLEDRRYRQHAFWLVQAVSSVVDNLDNLDETVSTMFNELGEKHAAIPYFNTNYFGLLSEVWGKVWEERLKGRYTPHAEKAWGKLFRYVVACLAEGFQLVGLEHSFQEEEGSSISGYEPLQESRDVQDNEYESSGRKRQKLKKMLGATQSKEPSVGMLVTTPSDEEPGRRRVTTASLGTSLPLQQQQQQQQRTREPSMTQVAASTLSPLLPKAEANTSMLLPPTPTPQASFEMEGQQKNLVDLVTPGGWLGIRRKRSESNTSQGRSNVDSSTGTSWLHPGMPRLKGKKPEKEFQFLQHDQSKDRQTQSSEARQRRSSAGDRKVSYFAKFFHNSGSKPDDEDDKEASHLSGYVKFTADK